MKSEILERVLPQLDEMVRVIKFGRKKIKDEVVCSLTDFYEIHLSLGEEMSKYRKQAQELASVKVALEKENLDVKGKLYQREERLAGLGSEHELLKAKCELISNNAKELESAKETLEKENLDVKGKLHQREKSLADLESEHGLLETKHDLISNILSADPEFNEALGKFRHVLNNEFMNFANDESSLAEEAKAIMIMKGVEKELELTASFPDIYNKNIIAIGGGFSSGKSAFVNSLFQESNIKLPIGIEPVTAIPTYIISGDGDVVKGYSKNGGVIDISVELYGKLSHGFVKSFRFNLKDIMPFMAIETRIHNIENICFIDTPGYNPSVTDGFTSEDEKTAAEYLEQAHALIWMIGLDSVGTIPASDLKFLEGLDLENKRLYVIANKADLRSVDDLEDILDEIEESLNDYDIEYAGISAFSANQKRNIHSVELLCKSF